MWEKLKENGFNIASIAVVFSNLFLFVLIALTGIVRVWEPTRWILVTEITLCVILIIWGLERLIKDLRR